MSNNIFFPTCIVDGFLDFPDEMREWGLSLPFEQDKEGRWPGERSPPIHEINEMIFKTLISKIVSLFYSGDNYTYTAYSTFQLVDKKFGEGGWIHKDSGVITAILYLSPDGDRGTSLFKIKTLNETSNHILLNEDKKKAYVNLQNNQDSMEKSNSNFQENIRVDGLYNRLLLFDSRIYHGANGYFGENTKNSRLTLVTFIQKLFSDEGYPITRSKNILSSINL